MGRRAWGVQVAICFAVLTLMAAMGLAPASGTAPHAGTVADPSLLAATVFPLDLDVVPAATASGFDPLVMRAHRLRE